MVSSEVKEKGEGLDSSVCSSSTLEIVCMNRFISNLLNIVSIILYLLGG